MFTEIRIRNCFSFEESVSFSMEADMRNKKFAYNVSNNGMFNTLKSAGIYGPNNSGKTCLIKCIKAIKSILLHESFNLKPNMFSGSSICELGVTFISANRKFNYDIKYDTTLKEYIYEKFTESIKDVHGNEHENIWLLKDYLQNEFEFVEDNLSQMINLVSKNNLLIYQLDVNKFSVLNEIKEIATSFASNIDVIDMNTITLDNTIEILKKNDAHKSKVVEFIKQADLYLDDLLYLDKGAVNFSEFVKALEDKNVPEVYKDKFVEELKLFSVYRGKPVASVLFDSMGTKKITAIASYVISALQNGRILVVDELDSSIHFKLTRAIVSMFNNELNKGAQLIFTVHDINLMDCKRLFRKEQIWFVHKDTDRVYLYSLSDFTAQQGVRDTTDIIEKYKKGALGALPEPDLINSLITINGNGDNANDEK